MTRQVQVRAQGIASDETSAFVNEVFVTVGQTVERETALLSIELSKTTVEAFAPEAGRVTEVRVSTNSSVRGGDLLVVLEVGEPERSALPDAPAMPAAVKSVLDVHASPWIRRLARERGLDLAHVSGTGRNGRILEGDLGPPVESHAKALEAEALAPQLAAPPPKVAELRSLSSLQRAVARNVSKSWADIPHVTQFDEADITELEAFRVVLNQERKDDEPKLTLLPFIIKASACSLAAFADFNGSLRGERLVARSEINIGFAVDTGDGLRVPVIRGADRMTLRPLAAEIARLAERARAGKLSPAEMQDGSFTISNLGGVGGTAFTPIVNGPELAILGISKSETKPKWNGRRFVPRLMLPLSLSYDHRLINGMAGARFVSHLGSVLSDLRRALL